MWNKNKLTLRDHFAAQAMNGAMSGMHVQSIPTLAKLSYKIADAMLEARNSAAVNGVSDEDKEKGISNG